MDSLDRKLWAATIAVVVGVVLEVIKDIQEVKEKIEWNERRPWRPIIPKVGSVILVLGLAFEIVFQTKISQREATFRTAAANRIEKLNNEADDARRQLAKEQKKRLALMEALSVYRDRHISRIISYLDTDRPITIEIAGDDAETDELACEMKYALKAMLCSDVRIASGPRDIGGVTPDCIAPGVTIFCTDCPNGKDAVTGKLQAFLTDPLNNVAAKVGSSTCGPFPPKGIVILVGKHSLLVDADLFEAMPDRLGVIEEMQRQRADMFWRHQSMEGLLNIPHPCSIVPR